jgi:hypothetical protein
LRLSPLVDASRGAVTESPGDMAPWSPAGSVDAFPAIEPPIGNLSTGELGSAMGCLGMAKSRASRSGDRRCIAPWSIRTPGDGSELRLGRAAAESETGPLELSPAGAPWGDACKRGPADAPAVGEVDSVGDVPCTEVWGPRLLIELSMWLALSKWTAEYRMGFAAGTADDRVAQPWLPRA